MEGPPPSDPSVLDSVAGGADIESPVAASPPLPSSSRPVNVTPTQPAAPVQSSTTAPLSYGQQQARQLLSPGMSGRPTAAQTTVAPATSALASASQPIPPSNDLFSLDFNAPPPNNSGFTDAAPRKDVKQDILSLFSSPASASAPQPAAFGSFAATAPSPASAWDAFGAASAAQPATQPTAQQSMMGSTGAGMWGTSSGWSQPAAPASSSASIWGAATAPPPSGLMSSNDVWGSSTTATSGSAPASDIFLDKEVLYVDKCYRKKMIASVIYGVASSRMVVHSRSTQHILWLPYPHVLIPL
jgi:stromal membrane-associated protein